jgi:DNA-binding CsgD family transcriptional regulator
LAPLAFESGEEWRRAAARAVERCLGGNGASFALQLEGEPLLAAEPDVLHALQAVDPPPKWVVEGLTRRRQERGLTVTNWDELFEAEEVRRTPFYNEVVRPHRLLAPLVMLRDTGTFLPAALSVYFEDEKTAGRRVSRQRHLLQLLFPAFCAGLDAYLTVRQNQAALNALADSAPIGALIFDERGMLRRENECFRQQMAADRDRDQVRAEIARVVRGILRFPAFDGLSAREPRGVSEVRTRAARYKIVATFFGDRVPGSSAIALVQKLEPSRPNAHELGARFSLTNREIEIAQLLRCGLSSRQIAQELAISVNTTRRHVERILLKLDVHTRAAAAAILSGV